MNPYHRRLERHYSESLIAAMRARGVYEAMDTGTPATLDLSFGGPGLIGCTLQFDFTKDKTRDDRARSLYAFFTRAVARLVAAHIAQERGGEGGALQQLQPVVPVVRRAQPAPDHGASDEGE